MREALAEASAFAIMLMEAPVSALILPIAIPGGEQKNISDEVWDFWYFQHFFGHFRFGYTLALNVLIDLWLSRIQSCFMYLCPFSNYIIWMSILCLPKFFIKLLNTSDTGGSLSSNGGSDSLLYIGYQFSFQFQFSSKNGFCSSCCSSCKFSNSFRR